MNIINLLESLYGTTCHGVREAPVFMVGAFFILTNSLASNNTSLDCSISANKVYVRKTGNLVRVQHSGAINGTLTVNTEVTLCTLPVDFRPKLSFAKNIIYRNSTNKDLIGYGLLVAASSGNVNFIPYNVPDTSGILRFDETFVIT